MEYLKQPLALWTIFLAGSLCKTIAIQGRVVPKGESDFAMMEGDSVHPCAWGAARDVCGDV